MSASDSFVVLEQMIHKGEIGIAELKHLLSSLESQGQITSEESQSLLELALRLEAANKPPS